MSLLPVFKRSGSSGYTLINSMDLSLTSHLDHAFAVAGNQRKWTFATWAKVDPLASNLNTLFSASGSSATQDTENIFYDDSNGRTRFYSRVGNSQKIDTMFTESYSPDVWAHVCVQKDTDSLLVTTEIDGVVSGQYDLGSSFSDHSGYISSTELHVIGGSYVGPYPYKGKLADTHFIDGENYDSSYFITPELAPKEFTASHGQNGFHFLYEDALNLGKNEVGPDWDQRLNPEQTTDVPS